MGAAGETPEKRLPSWLAPLAVYVVVFFLTDARLWRPSVVFDGVGNTQIAEAEAWWQGRLDLGDGKDGSSLRTGSRWDVARYDNQYFSHFPLMFTMIAAMLVPLFQGVPHGFVVLLVAMIPLLAYRLFRRRTGSAVWGGVLSVGFVCGTSLWPILDKTIRGADPYRMNHTIATIGLLVLLNEAFGKKRMGLACAGWIMAALSRQLTIFFALPLLVLARQVEDPSVRRRRTAVWAASVGVAMGLPLLFNTLKFDHPLTTGYMLIYEGREDHFAEDAHRHGLFSVHFLQRNLYYANLGFPRVHEIEVGGEKEIHLRPNTQGTGIWWTTPLLLWLLIGWKDLFRARASRGWLVGVVAVFGALMLFHATGAEQRGYNRFSMDYLPVLMALLAPICVQGRRRWISLVMVGWSVVYFTYLIWPHAPGMLGRLLLPFG